MRRASSPFNLSLLDLLTAALGAVIFLFVITPKGRSDISAYEQASLFFDTATMQIHGTLPDSLVGKRQGDTLFAMLVDYKAVNGPDVGGLRAELAAERRRAAEAERARRAALEDAATAEREIAEAQAARQAALAASRNAKSAAEKARAERQLAEAKRKQAEADRHAADAKRKQAEAIAAAKPTPAPPAQRPTSPPAPRPSSEAPYRGTLPSVPARLSFELKWDNAADNVDLYVCQGNTCVYGNNKRERSIGSWDSGKSRNRLFGNDLRTNQEAVRQFDELLPGTYTLYANFKESSRGASSVQTSTLIYTKDDNGKPRGKTITRTLPLSETRQRIAAVTVKADGSFTVR